MFGEVYDKNGVPVTAILDLEPSSNGGHLVDMYIVNSAYGKDVDLKGFIERSDVLYLDTGKNRANHWLQRLGLKLPLHAAKEGSMGSVTYSDGNVNISGTPWSDLARGAENLNQTEGSNAADTKSDTLDTGKDTKAATVENSPAPSGKYDENHPNRIAQWLVKEAQSALNAMGVQNAEISVDYSMDKNSNGYYVVKDGKRRIVLNGQLGGTTRNGQLYSAQQNIRFVLAHEIGHIAQGVGYTGETNLYTDQIIQMYEDVTGTTPNEVESGVREIMIQYMDEADRDGSSLGISRNDVTMDYAKGEYAANCLAEMLGNYNTLREIAKSQNRNLIQRAINKLERFQSKLITDRRRKSRIKQDIAAQARGDTASSAASNATDWVAVASLYDEAAEDIRSMLKKAMDNSRDVQAMNESVGGDTRTSVHAELGRSIDKYITHDSIKRQIEQVVEMKPVAELSGNEFQKDPNKSLDKMMHEFFNELGNSVETKTLGRVILDDAGIGSDMGHGVFSRKSAAIAAIPDVLGQGEIIDYQSNWKDRPYETVCIAAPVTLRGKLYYEGVIVRRLNYGDSFYTHDVLLAEAAEKAKDGALPQKTGSSEERVIARSKTPSIASLLLKVSEVKYQNEKSHNDSPARYSLNDSKDSHYDYSKPFAEQVEDYKNGKIPPRDSLVVGPTPDVFQHVGFNALPMTINQTHVNWALNDGKPGRSPSNGNLTEDHALGEHLLKQLPSALEHPVAIIQSESQNSTSVVALLEIKHEGDTIIAPVVVDGTGRQNGVTIDSNAITSVHGRQNAISALLNNALKAEENGNVGVYYLDTEKSPTLLQEARVRLPKATGISRGGFLHSIQGPGSPVKTKLSNVTESRQFKRWFGDWQNHPANASKVVNEDGTPKVMYHGTSNGGFNFFDTYNSNFGLFGTGSYFTDNMDVAKGYTKKGKGTNPQVYAAYLNIRNPLDMDATANVERWRSAASDIDSEYTDYFASCKTNEDCFRALKEYCQDQEMYSYDAYDYIRDIIESMGYDGITHIGGGRFNKQDGTRHRVYIAFSPEQVKSATDNIGTFDGSNPDIRYSLNTNETDLPGLDEDNTSKFSRFTNTYEKGTKLVGKSASTMAAAVLTQRYGSNASIQSIATKYRQMSTVAEQLENVYLDGMMGEEIIGRNNRNSVYEEAQRQLMELGREVADEIIDGATVKEQGDSTVYEYLKDRLRGEKIYVPDKIKQNVAETLQCDTWGEARRKYFGVLSNTVNDASKGIEIDSLYNAIQEEFPGAIRGEVLSRADQLSAIIDAYNSARDSQSVEYNPLARNITERSDNRERIAQDVVSRMEALAREHAMNQYNEYSAAKKSEAARLERQAAYQERQAKAEQSEGKSGEAAQKRADALKEQAAEAKLMSQTDEETILESVHTEGLGGEAAEQRLEQSILSPEILEWAKHSKELDRVVARMLAMQKRNKQMVSQVRSNTFAGSDFFTEAELALDGMRPGDFTYKVKPEAESFGEAASRLIGKVKDKLQSQNDLDAQKVTLDRGEYEHQKQDLKEAAGRLDDNYLHWYETLQSKDHWTGVDLDTAMMILNQIRTNDRAIGDYRESSKWAKMIQERGTEGGQFIQSFAKWSRTTDGMIARATQELDDNHLGREVNGKAIQRLNEENQQTSEQITIETQKNDALRKENDELLKEREHLREELKKAREINRNAGKENDNLYDKIDNDIEKILRITKEIQEKDGENIRLQDIVDVLDGKVRDRLAKVSQLGTENTQIVAERDRLTAQYEGLEQQNSQLETMIAAGQKEVEMLKAAIDALKQKNGAQEISLTDLTQELQDVLDGLKADREDAVQQKGILQKILQGLSRTKDPAKIRELVTKTTNQKLNDRWGRLMGDLLDNVASWKKTRIINDMTRIADMINAAESWQLAANAGDKTAELKMRNQLIDCIMDAAKTRGMKPSRKVEEWMRKNFSAQDTAYLNKFARTSLANIADDYQGSSAGQKLSTWQYLAQLLNFRTAARNVVSNAAFQGIDTVARNGGVWIDVLLSKKTGNRTIGYSARHGSDTSAWAGAKDRAGRAMLEVMLDVDTESGNARSKYGESARRTYKMAQQGISGALSRTMSRLEMINGISLNVTDEFFKGAIYQGTINANAKLVAEGLMTMEESIQFATEDMLYRTFQDDTLVGSLLNSLHDAMNKIGVGSERAKSNGTYKENGTYVHDFGLGDIVCKYRGVPGALITRAVEFSPMGYLKAIYNAGKLVKSGGTDTSAQRNFALGLSRASTGSGLIALFAWLCANGLLKREEDEDDKNVAALDRAEGLGGTQLNLSAIKRLILGEENATEWQNGDELTDIGFLDPLSSTMTMGAMIAKSMKEDGSPFLAALAGAQGGMTAAAFSDLSMMDTINDLVYTIVYHDEQSDLPILADVGATLATSAITGFEPSLLRQAAQASDNHYRDVYGGGAVEDWINKNIPGKSDTAAAIQKGLNSIAVNLPGLRQTVPTKLDPMGNEKVYSPSDSVGRNIANAFFNPGKNSVYTVGSVSEEMGRVRRLTGETGFYPDRNAPNSISFGSDYGNEKVKLTDAQKRRYVLDAGNAFESLAEETMKTDAYKNATNDEKAELLQDVKSYAAYKAKQQLYENLHARDKGYTPYVNDDWGKTEAGMDAGIKFGEMRRILSDTSERKMPSDYDENGDTISGSREGKILDYINDLGYKDDQKLNLYGIIRGSGSESSVEKMQNVMDAGLSFYEASKVRKEFNAINDKPHTINDSDMNNHDYFNKWLNDEGYSESEIETINENYKFYTQIRQESDSILKRLTESGMDYDSAYEVANKVAAIEPEDDEDEVAISQKYNVILDDYNMSTGEKQAAIAAIAGTKSVFGDLDEGAAQTMMDLFSQTGQASAISANAGTSYTVDGTKYDYTEDQQEAYNQAYIGILNNISGASVSSVKTMEDIRDIAANAGKYAALEQAGLNPDLDSSDYGAYRKAQQAMNAGLDLATYCEIKSTCNSFSADKDSNGKSISGSKKKKVVAYLRSQGLSTQQYNFFYNTIMGYK